MNPTGTTAVFEPVWLMAAAAAVLLGTANRTFAHCDTMNGPVIPEAKGALEKGDVSPILKWIQKENEVELRAAFAKAVVVRAKGAEAKELADQYFLETLVRLHRVGEGAPYTGLKDEPVEPIVEIADKALADGSADDMIKNMTSHMAKAIREKFDKAREAGNNRDKSVETGREYVEADILHGKRGGPHDEAFQCCRSGGTTQFLGGSRSGVVPAYRAAQPGPRPGIGPRHVRTGCRRIGSF